MKRHLPTLLFATAALHACGDDGGAAARGDAAIDAAVPPIVMQDAGAYEPDTGTDSAPPDLSEPPFSGTGLPDGLPWGPGLLAVQDELNAEGQPDDIAFGVFWDPEAVVVDYNGDRCVGFRTELGTEVGRDVGTITVTGGSGVDTQALTRSPEGYYHLGDEVDPWNEGDSVSFSGDGVAAGPLTIPGAFSNTNLDGLRDATRGEDLGLQFIGAQASHVSVSISAQTDNQRYLLACITPIGEMIWSVPGAALASIPAPVEEVEIKIQAANIDQRSDYALIAVGDSAVARIPLLR